MGCAGPKLAWCNGRAGQARTYICLDRVLVNAEWRGKFLEDLVKNLLRVYSDHSPLVIYMGGTNSHTYSSRPFRFEACWLLHESFESFVKDNWDNLIDFFDNLVNFKDALIY